MPSLVLRDGLFWSAMYPADAAPNGNATKKPTPAPISADFHRDPLLDATTRSVSATLYCRIDFRVSTSSAAGLQERNLPSIHDPSRVRTEIRCSGMRSRRLSQF